ncbi:MAG: HEPN domain-containing protein [Rhodospirillaceae bacterium]|nr:HEPN domain-containing protein [Rhodospirillaceae bacterium]
MTASRQAASFLSLAREDLAAAKALLETFPRHAAFNLSQAAEKIIKAVLTSEGLSMGTSHHQLGRLVQLLPAGHFWREELMGLDKHTAAATIFRYPAAGGAMPSVPPIERLTSHLRELEALLPEIEDWRRER